MSPALEQCLYLFSNALLIPTLIAIIALALWTALLAGGLVREWLERDRVRAGLARLGSLLNSGDPDPAQWREVRASCPAGLPARLLRRMPEPPTAVERDKCLEDLEWEVTAQLSRLTWMTRVAPMLGLMGTLIPLGPALTGLASGDMAKLSSNLVVAFTATVAGVFLGCAAFTMSLIRKSWYGRDLSDLEHLFTRRDGVVPTPPQP